MWLRAGEMAKNTCAEWAIVLVASVLLVFNEIIIKECGLHPSYNLHVVDAASHCYTF